MPSLEGLPTDPAGVWSLIVHADELRKYAPNRDAETARAQALQVLEHARRALAGLADRSAAAKLGAQIDTRLADLS